MFADRTEAGEKLSERLAAYQGKNAVVIGLARGGVVVAKAVAQKLSLPYDVAVVKKVSPSFDSELAIGAVAPDSVSFIDYRFAQRLGVDERYLQEEIEKKSALIKQKMQAYRKGRPTFFVAGKIAIVVDDGAATGATIEAAIKWLRKKNVKRFVVALPVAPPDVVSKVNPEVDELIVLDTPSEFSSVGQWYKEFKQVEDEEVIQLLQSDKSDKYANPTNVS